MIPAVRVDSRSAVNERYFVCRDCKMYIDAGYRWCYWELEHSGIVERGETVNMDAVLGHETFWNPVKDSQSDWLYNDVFPAIRAFFDEHRGHDVRYWEENDLPDDAELHWLQLGRVSDPSARYLTEVLGLVRWEEVLAWKEQSDILARSWRTLWDVDGRREMFRQAFEHYASRGRKT